MAGSVERSEAMVEVRPGLRLHVITWTPAGDVAEPPFLLVHGLSSNARLWEGVGRRLAEAGHVAVAVDQRGHGLSDKPDGGYDFETIDGDLERLIEQLPLDRPVVAGQSWGGEVVLDLGASRPEIVRGIVTVDGTAWDMQANFPSWEACWERLAPPRIAGTPLADVERYFTRAHPDWSDEAIESSLANLEHRPDGTVAPWLTRERHELILRAMWKHRPSELWPALRIPALVIVADTGDAAWSVGKRQAMARVEAALTRAGAPHRIVWFEADHDIHAQHPELVAGEMLDAVAAGLFAGATVTTETAPQAGANAAP